MTKERILVCCALPDDAAVGAGGTIAKYVKEGKFVKTLVFSYGELGQAHLLPELVRDLKRKEAEEADKILGGNGVEFLGLDEGDFVKQAVQPVVRRHLKALLEIEKPNKIFVHSPDDPQPSHRAVHKIITSLVKALKLDAELYSFDVWSPMSFLNRGKPKLIVNTTGTMDQKVRAIDAHVTQRKLFVGHLLDLKVHIKDYYNGSLNGCRYAEVFVRL